ncbi:MAG: serine hydrolase domain-containing protein [Allomuricauda sp.]
MSMKKNLFLFILSSIYFSPIHAQGDDSLVPYTKIDSLLFLLSQNEQFNGGILLAEGNRVKLKKAYGLADFKTGRPLTDQTIFQCASISKTFTAAAIFKLMEEHKIALEDRLTDYFPQLPYPEIRIKHLLGHTSGLYPYNPLFAENWDHSKIATNADIINMYAQEKPDLFFEPGTEFAYSNVGYVFLSSIVEQISGLTFEAYLEKQIFGPLDLKNTRTHNLLSQETLEDYAMEHILDPLSGSMIGPLESGYHSYTYYLNGKLGDDKVATTLDDLWKWNRALFKSNFLGDQHSKLAFSLSNGEIPPEKRHSRFDYGMGFQLDSIMDFGRVIYHDGGEPGLKARFYYYPERDLTLILYMNAHVKYIRPIKKAILSILNSNSFEVPKKSIADELAKVAHLNKDNLQAVLERTKKDTLNFYASESEINDVANIFWSREMYEKGFEILAVNLELFPKSVGAVYTMGEAYMETEQMDKAVPYFKKARKLMLERPKEKQNARFLNDMEKLINDYKKK